MDEVGEVEVTFHVVYRWECPNCLCDNDEESDPQGEEVECGDCYKKFAGGEVR